MVEGESEVCKKFGRDLTRDFGVGVGDGVGVGGEPEMFGGVGKENLQLQVGNFGNVKDGPGFAGGDFGEFENFDGDQRQRCDGEEIQINEVPMDGQERYGEFEQGGLWGDQEALGENLAEVGQQKAAQLIVEEVGEERVGELRQNPEELVQVPAHKQNPSISLGLGTASHEKPSQEEASAIENPNWNYKNVTSMDALQMSHNQLVDYATDRQERLHNEALLQNPQLFEESHSSTPNPTTSNLSPTPTPQSKRISSKNIAPPSPNPLPVTPIPFTDPLAPPKPNQDTNLLPPNTPNPNINPTANLNTPNLNINSFLGQQAQTDFMDPFADCERQIAIDTAPGVNMGFLIGDQQKSEVKVEEGGLEGLGGLELELELGVDLAKGEDAWLHEGDAPDKLF